MSRLAYPLDVLVVLLFAAAGRSSHALGVSAAGVLETAWPFLAGLVVGWVAVLRQPAGRHAWWLDGVVVAACTLVVGMLLRLATGAGAAPTFVLVAAVVLAGGLVGWRAVAAVVARRRAAR